MCETTSSGYELPVDRSICGPGRLPADGVGLRNCLSLVKWMTGLARQLPKGTVNVSGWD
jgi:hypothetical protein